jgi:hypothetical protein
MISRTKALRLARKKYGREAGIRERASSPTDEQRVAWREQLLEHRKHEPQPPPPTPEQLEYRRRHQLWKEESQRLQGLVLQGKRYQVWRPYHIPGLGTGASIEGEGNTLEEALKAAFVEMPED